MTTPHLDPVLQQRLPLLHGVPGLGPTQRTPKQVERLDAFYAGVDGYAPPVVEISSHVVSGPHGDVPVRLYRSNAAGGRRGLVWIHGGGFQFGDMDMPESDVVARELAAAGLIIVTVDYHLCRGGVHFPVPHDDVYAAFLWARSLRFVGETVHSWGLGGASAGGNLAAGVAQRLRDEGGPTPASLVLAYPLMHYPVPPASPDQDRLMASVPDALRFTDQSVSMHCEAYLGRSSPQAPYAFPGFGDAAGLPPAFIILSEFDDLMPSGAGFASALKSVGSSVSAVIAEGAPHGHLNIPGLPVALRSIGAIVEFVGASQTG